MDTLVTLPYSTATLDGLFAVAQHASKDDTTPIITTVRVDSHTFTATNRYTVGQWRHTGDDFTETGEHVLIPRSAAEWLSKQSPKALGHAEFALSDPEVGAVIEFTPESISIQYAGQTLAVTRFEVLRGNFPPVARLFPPADKDHSNAPTIVSLAPEYLEMFIRGCKRAAPKHAPIRFTLTDSGNPNKPGPVLATFGTDNSFRGMVQPVLR